VNKTAGLIGGIFFLSSVLGCTQPGETTTVAATTGGVMGAGLGAIIGSQTGSAGAGLALGAVAGSGAGALIGNSFEAQEKMVRAQDEAIARQQRTIETQHRELDELRRLTETPRKMHVTANTNLFKSEEQIAERKLLTGPRPIQLTAEQRRIKKAYARAHPLRESGSVSGTNEYAFHSETSSSEVRIADAKSRQIAADTAARLAAKAASNTETAKTEAGIVEVVGEVREADVALNGNSAGENEASKGAFDWTAVKRAVTDTGSVTVDSATKSSVGLKEKELTVGSIAEDSNMPAAPTNTPNKQADALARNTPQSDCAQAAEEIQSGESAENSPDKLFHFRRALRLCPKNADYHTRLGEVYLSLNRPSDAVYEFKEALSADPSHAKAKEKLASVGRY